MTRPTKTPDPQLTRISLATDDPSCQVCGDSLHEGDNITAYAYRAAGEPTYAIGYLMCGADVHKHPTVFTRGVHEYVLTGYIGTCTNTHTQSETFVLLDPTAVVTSSPRTTDPHVHPNTQSPREPTDATRRGPTPLVTVVRERARSDGGALHDQSE